MIIKDLVLLTVLFIAACQDIAENKVKNVLIISGIISGFIFCHTLTALIGFIIPFIVLYPFFLTRQIGAADIKLLMMTGIYIGSRGLGICILPTAVIALTMGICIAAYSNEPVLKTKIPFAVPIFLGIVPYIGGII